jgi:hypothetical protein
LYKAEGDNTAPVAHLKGLSNEGFGLSWNPTQKGLLVGATGETICLWDTNNIGIKG